MNDFKSGFVSLIGRTNAGKSTLLNSLINEKVSIVTPKVQTTRTAIKAIINNENSQIIITDTPGFHKPKNKLSKTMIDTAVTMIKEVDVILFIIDSSSKKLLEENEEIIERLKESNKPCILIINKIDLVSKEKILDIINIFKDKYDFKAIIPISALKNEEINTVVCEIEKLLPVRSKIL